MADKSKKENIKMIIFIVVWGALFLILFLSYMYEDCLSIIHFERDVLGSVFEGKGILDFYSYGTEKAKWYSSSGIGGASYPYYCFFVYIILGVWGIPVYIWETISGGDVTGSFACLIYGKSIYLVAIIICSILVYKICVLFELEHEKSILCVLCFNSSVLVFSSVAVIGQMDIIAMIFSLSGIYMLMRDNKRLFFMFFCMAICMKVLAIFLFFPLLLLYEKNVRRILIKLITVVLPYLILYLPFSRPKPMKGEHFFLAMIHKLFGNTLPLLSGRTTLLVIVLGIFYAVCFLRNKDKFDKRSVLLTSAMGYYLLFISFDGYPYWYLRLCPWIVMSIFILSSQIKLSLMFETVGMAALQFSQYVRYTWCYDAHNGKFMLLNFLMRGKYNPLLSMGGYLETLKTTSEKSFDLLIGLPEAFFVICVGFSLFLCFPIAKKYIEPDKNIGYSQIWSRLIINAIVAFVPFGVLLVGLFK